MFPVLFHFHSKHAQTSEFIPLLFFCKYSKQPRHAFSIPMAETAGTTDATRDDTYVLWQHLMCDDWYDTLDESAREAVKTLYTTITTTEGDTFTIPPILYNNALVALTRCRFRYLRYTYALALRNILNDQVTTLVQLHDAVSSTPPGGSAVSVAALTWMQNGVGTDADEQKIRAWFTERAQRITCGWHALCTVLLHRRLVAKVASADALQQEWSSWKQHVIGPILPSEKAGASYAIDQMNAIILKAK